MSVCQQNPEMSELVGMAQKGLGRSGRVWKGLEGSRGSLEGHGFQASLKKVGHPGTRYPFWGLTYLNQKMISARYTK